MVKSLVWAWSNPQKNPELKNGLGKPVWPVKAYSSILSLACRFRGFSAQIFCTRKSQGKDVVKTRSGPLPSYFIYGKKIKTTD